MVEQPRGDDGEDGARGCARHAEQRAFENEQPLHATLAQAQGPDGADLDRSFHHRSAHRVAHGEQHDGGDENEDEAEDHVEHLHRLHEERVEFAEPQHRQRLTGSARLEQLGQSLPGRLELCAALQLDHDSRCLGAVPPVDQALRLGQVQHQVDLVELLETLTFGTHDLERHHVRRTAGAAGQDLDPGLAARRGRRLGNVAQGELGDIGGQRIAARLRLLHRPGAIGNIQWFAQQQHARHASAHDCRVSGGAFEREGRGDQRQIEAIPGPHAIQVGRHHAQADDRARDAGREIAGDAAELQRRRHYGHHAAEHFVARDGRDDLVVAGDRVLGRVAAAIEKQVAMLDLQVATFTHIGRVHAVFDILSIAAEQQDRRSADGQSNEGRKRPTTVAQQVSHGQRKIDHRLSSMTSVRSATGSGACRRLMLRISPSLRKIVSSAAPMTARS